MRTSEEMYPIVEDWQASGLTQKEYSRRHGMPKHILPYWAARYRQEKNGEDEKPVGFAPIKFATPVGATPERNVEIVLPNGIVVRLPDRVSPSYLQQVLRICSV